MMQLLNRSGTGVQAAKRGLGKDSCPSCRPMADWEAVPKGRRAQRQAQARAVERQQQQQADNRQKAASLMKHQGGDEEGQLAGVIEASKLEQNASDTMAKVIAESLATAAREREFRAMAGVEAEQEAYKRSMQENYGRKFCWQEQESQQPTLAPVSEEEEQQQLEAVLHQTKVEAGLVPNHKPQSSRASALSPVAEESSDVERSREEQEAAYFSSIALGEDRPPSPPPPPKATPASPPPPPRAPAPAPAPVPVPAPSPTAAPAPAKPQQPAEDDDDEQLRRAKEMSMLTYNYEMNYREPALRIGNVEAFDDFVEPTVSEPQPPAPPAQPQVPQPPARTPPTTTKCAAPAPAPATAPIPRAPSPPKAGKKKKNKKKANGNGGGGGGGALAPPPQQQQRQQPQERHQPWQQQQQQQQKPQQQAAQKPKHSVAPWAKPPAAPVAQRPRTPASTSPARPPPSSLDATADDEEARLLARVKVMSLLGEVDVQQAREMTDEEIRQFLSAAQAGADDDARSVGTDEEEERLLNQAREESMRLQAEQEGKERKETTKRALQGAGVWKIEDECEIIRLNPGQEYAVDVLRGREDNQVEWYRVCHRVRLQFQERRIVVRALQSKTGAALFKQHELDQIADNVQIAAQSVKEVLQNPEHIIQQRREMKCHVYVDWSNIILGAQPSRDRSAGLRIRVDVDKFAALLEQDRTLHSGRVAGSNHPFYKEDWDQWRRHNYDAFTENVLDHKTKGERNVDNHLKYHIGMELAMKQYPDPLNHVLVLATGDGNLFDERGVESNKVCNFPEAVEACLKQSYRVELWTWQNSCSRRFYQMRKEYNQLMSIRHLDDFREYVCAVPDELRASVGLNPLQPQAASPGRRWSPSAPEFIPATPGPAGGSGASHLRMPQGVHLTPPGQRGMSPGQRRGTPKTTPSPPQHPPPVNTDGFHLNGFALPSPHIHPQSHTSPEGERAWMPAPPPPGLGLPNNGGFYTNGTAFDAAPQRQNGAAHTPQQPSFNGPMGFGLDAFNQTVLPVPSPATNLPTTEFSVFQAAAANGHVSSSLYGCATTQELVQEQPGFASWQASPQPVINQPSPVFQPAVNGNKTNFHLSPYSSSSPEQNGVSGYDPQPHRSPPGLSRAAVPVVQAPPDEIDPMQWY